MSDTAVCDDGASAAQALHALARVLLDFGKAPGRYSLRLGEPAALHAQLDTLAQWALGRIPEPLQAQAAALQEAAVLFVQRLCFAPDNTHYQVLALAPQQLNPEALRARYRTLIRLTHPDMGVRGLPQNAAGLVNRAHEVLGSAVLRSAYDQQLAQAAARVRTVPAPPAHAGRPPGAPAAGAMAAREALPGAAPWMQKGPRRGVAEQWQALNARFPGLLRFGVVAGSAGLLVAVVLTWAAADIKQGGGLVVSSAFQELLADTQDAPPAHKAAAAAQTEAGLGQAGRAAAVPAVAPAPAKTVPTRVPPQTDAPVLPKATAALSAPALPPPGLTPTPAPSTAPAPAPAPARLQASAAPGVVAPSAFSDPAQPSQPGPAEPKAPLRPPAPVAAGASLAQVAPAAVQAQQPVKPQLLEVAAARAPAAAPSGSSGPFAASGPSNAALRPASASAEKVVSVPASAAPALLPAPALATAPASGTNTAAAPVSTLATTAAPLRAAPAPGAQAVDAAQARTYLVDLLRALERPSDAQRAQTFLGRMNVQGSLLSAPLQLARQSPSVHVTGIALSPVRSDAATAGAAEGSLALAGTLELQASGASSADASFEAQGRKARYQVLAQFIATAQGAALARLDLREVE